MLTLGDVLFDFDKADPKPAANEKQASPSDETKRPGDANEGKADKKDKNDDKVELSGTFAAVKAHGVYA